VVNKAISEMVFASANSQVQSAVYSRYSSPLTPGSVSRALPTQNLQCSLQKPSRMNAEASRYLCELSEVVKVMHSMSDSGESEGRPESGSSADPVRP
jgi:hypothetical protein